jgi:hypothetical protein
VGGKVGGVRRTVQGGVGVMACARTEEGLEDMKEEELSQKSEVSLRQAQASKVRSKRREGGGNGHRVVGVHVLVDESPGRCWVCSVFFGGENGIR